MKAVIFVIGFVVVVAVVKVASGPTQVESPAVKADRERFCALSPDGKQVMLWNSWQRERTKPGSSWRDYKEFSAGIRSFMGC